MGGEDEMSFIRLRIEPDLIRCRGVPQGRGKKSFHRLPHF